MLFFKKMMIILRWSTKQAVFLFFSFLFLFSFFFFFFFSLGVQYLLNLVPMIVTTGAWTRGYNYYVELHLLLSFHKFDVNQIPDWKKKQNKQNKTKQTKQNKQTRQFFWHEEHV